jgi:hypothetical protein
MQYSVSKVYNFLINIIESKGRVQFGLETILKVDLHYTTFA